MQQHFLQAHLVDSEDHWDALWSSVPFLLLLYPMPQASVTWTCLLSLPPVLTALWISGWLLLSHGHCVLNLHLSLPHLLSPFLSKHCPPPWYAGIRPSPITYNSDDPSVSSDGFSRITAVGSSTLPLYPARCQEQLILIQKLPSYLPAPLLLNCHLPILSFHHYSSCAIAPWPPISLYHLLCTSFWSMRHNLFKCLTITCYIESDILLSSSGVLRLFSFLDHLSHDLISFPSPSSYIWEMRFFIRAVPSHLSFWTWFGLSHMTGFGQHDWTRALKCICTTAVVSSRAPLGAFHLLSQGPMCTSDTDLCSTAERTRAAVPTAWKKPSSLRQAGTTDPSWREGYAHLMYGTEIFVVVH